MKLISTFVFAKQIVQFLYFLGVEFKASSHGLCLYSSVCVGPVQISHCWFPHDRAQLCEDVMKINNDRKDINNNKFLSGFHANRTGETNKSFRLKMDSST